MTVRSTEEIQQELDVLAKLLQGAIPAAIETVCDAAGAETLYAAMLLTGPDMRSVSIAGNTIEHLDRNVERFGGDNDRFAWQLSVPEWGLQPGASAFGELNQRLEALAASLDFGEFANDVAPLWERTLAGALIETDLREMVTTRYEGSPLVGVSAHEPEGKFALILEVSEAVNTPAWHEQLVAYAAVYAGSPWPAELSTVA